MTAPPDLQKLLDAGKPLPAGLYPISKTIVLQNRTGLSLEWGGITFRRAPGFSGPLLQLDGVIFSCLRGLSLDGVDSQGTNLLISNTGYGSGICLLENINSANAAVHIQAGVSAGDANCADLDFVGVRFQNGGACFRVVNFQGVNYRFHGGDAENVQTVFDFQRGGNLTVNGFGVAGGAGAVVLALGADAGQDNDYLFNLLGVRVETGTLVNAAATGGAQINLIGCRQAAMVPGPGNDYAALPPAIVAAGRSRVIAQGCLLGAVRLKDQAQVRLRDCLLPDVPLLDPGVQLESCMRKYWNTLVVPSVVPTPSSAGAGGGGA